MKQDNFLDGCPDTDRWMVIAAGAESPELTGPLLAHASTCKVCAPRLKDAAYMLADQEDVVEDQFLASLRSSTPAWQRRMAAQLAAPAPSARRKLQWFTTRWQMAAAAVFAFGILWLAVPRHGADPHPPNSAAISPAPKLPDAPVIQPPPGVPGKELKLFASLTLEPGVTRGLDRIPSLKLAKETRTVLLTLLFLDPTPSKLHVDLIDSTNRKVWKRDLEVTELQSASQRVTIRIPSALMRTTDDYQIVASEITGSGTEAVASYRYRIAR